MRRKGQEEWMRDVELSQRNIVFPDMVSNEATFWRNIISGKARLSIAQVLGIVLICGLLAAPVWEILRSLRFSVGWLFLCGCGALFLLLRWRVRRALK
jgi:hypothetical protein